VAKYDLQPPSRASGRIVIRALGKLAVRLDAEWKAAGYKTAVFPKLAARFLAGFRPGNDDRLRALSDWLLRSRTFPSPLNPFGSAGPPAFTVWANPRFVVNVYAYMTPAVVIHDHNFAGAFVNVLGRSLHCTYRFADAERISRSVQAGALSLRAGDLIPEDCVETIEAGSGFIHQVWHLARPTVVVVIRTRPLSRTVRQFEYLRPGLATEILRDATLVPRTSRRFEYARKLMECLRASSNGVSYATQLIKNEPPWEAVWHLVENWQFLQSNGALDDVLARASKAHGSWFRAMETAGPRIVLFYSINWHRVLQESDRVVLASLLTLDSWHQISHVLRSLWPDTAPEVLVADSLRRLARTGAIPVRLNDERHALLLCTLRGGGERDESHQTFDVRNHNDRKTAHQLERDLGDEELLKPLFNRDASAPIDNLRMSIPAKMTDP
jgi:hypothetical protein